MRKTKELNLRKMKRIYLTLLTVFLGGFMINAQESESWTTDVTHSSFGFKVMHKGISFTVGDFRDFELKISTPNSSFENASITLVVQAKSINTANESRDKHLRSSDFFDTDKYSEITFKSKKVTMKNEKEYTVLGDLSMHGVTKEIEIEMTHNGTVKARGKDLAGLYFTTTINREDFGVGPEISAANVAAEVELHAEIEIIKE